MFNVRNVGKTLVNRTQGLKNANDALKGRVFEVSLADLNQDEEQAFRKIKLRCDEIQGRNVLTNFHGLEFTSDKLRSLVKKWQTLIESHMDVKTSDGYLIRLFCIAFTRRRPDQIRKTTYAQTAQIRQIRKKMFDIIKRETDECNLKEIVGKLVPEVIGREIEKACQGIYPLQNVFIRKVKIIKFPRFDGKDDLLMRKTARVFDGGNVVTNICVMLQSPSCLNCTLMPLKKSVPKLPVMTLRNRKSLTLSKELYLVISYIKI